MRVDNNSFPKAYIFGAGVVGQWLLPHIRQDYQVLAFLDNDKTKQGSVVADIPIIAPSQFVADTDFDVIFIASSAGIKSITKQLLSMGVVREKIHTGYLDFSVKSRILFLRNLGEQFSERKITGSVAECGVFLGEFASEINKVFPKSNLYLFDTFTGFDERDLEVERELTSVQNDNVQYSDFKAGHFNITHEDIVMSNMPYPDKCIIRKGYFPETTEGLDETFCFVNLDFDLYKPTLAGLEYFYPRMVSGGVILVHDYFSDACKGVQKAVNEFKEKMGIIHIFPIDDKLSVGINC